MYSPNLILVFCRCEERSYLRVSPRVMQYHIVRKLVLQTQGASPPSIPARFQSSRGRSARSRHPFPSRTKMGSNVNLNAIGSQEVAPSCRSGVRAGHHRSLYNDYRNVFR